MVLLLFVCGSAYLFSADVDLKYFHDQLAQYGNWITVERYGLVWQPTGEGSDWKPYTDGYWVYSDYGWTFVSDKPWALAVYHYGRWTYDDADGWIWIPGTVWAPAWVAWRFGGPYIGWAPLPPEVEWFDNVGFYMSLFDIDVFMPYRSWCFVDQRRFCDRDVARYITKSIDNVRLFKRTSNITNYRFEDRKIINDNLPINRIEKIIGRRIDMYHLVDSTEPESVMESRIVNGTISFYRPHVRDSAENKDFERNMDKIVPHVFVPKVGTDIIAHDRNDNADNSVNNARSHIYDSDTNPYRNYDRVQQDGQDRNDQAQIVPRGRDEHSYTQNRERRRDPDYDDASHRR
jgi:hypothetical protein